MDSQHHKIKPSNLLRLKIIILYPAQLGVLQFCLLSPSQTKLRKWTLSVRFPMIFISAITSCSTACDSLELPWEAAVTKSSHIVESTNPCNSSQRKRKHIYLWSVPQDLATHSGHLGLLDCNTIIFERAIEKYCRDIVYSEFSKRDPANVQKQTNVIYSNTKKAFTLSTNVWCTDIST